MPQNACRECGTVPSEGKIGRGGRCYECGLARMMLGFRLNGVAARMTNRKLENLLDKLEAEYGRAGEPRRWYTRTPGGQEPPSHA